MVPFYLSDYLTFLMPQDIVLCAVSGVENLKKRIIKQKLNLLKDFNNDTDIG